jgi:uncharacterized phage protein (TIGR02218 family)
MSAAALYEHLATGLTTVCRCWSVRRRDGTAYGFTDHDSDVTFGGMVYRAATGMSASALVQGTGLSVDNTEALGVLSDAAITEADIAQGRFDGAEVEAWLVNWEDPDARLERFRGTIGELRRGAGAFYADLRGMTEALNQPQGRVYQRSCGAVLGDGACGFNLAQAGYSEERPAEGVTRSQVFTFATLQNPEPRWYERGRLRVLSGLAAGLVGVIKHDQVRADGKRVLELWEPVGAAVVSGDLVRIETGCDKRAETCRLKFNNFNNFRGFPHIPGEDWLISVPRGQGDDDGGSLMA